MFRKRQLVLAAFLGLIFLSAQFIAADSNECSSDATLLSPDKSWSICLLKNGNTGQVLINGVAGREYDWIGLPTFSPDNSRMAYKAQAGEEWFVVVGKPSGQQRENGPYSQIENILLNLDKEALDFSVFSEHGKLIYGARLKDKWIVVIENTRSPAYDWSRPVVLSPDEKSLAYKAKKDNKWLIVHDGKELPAFDWVGFPVFSPDGKSFAYIIRQNNQWSVMVGDKKIGNYDFIKSLNYPDRAELGQLSFNSNSELTYEVREKGEWFIIEGNSSGRIIEKNEVPLDEKPVEYQSGLIAGDIQNILEVTLKRFELAADRLRTISYRIDSRIDKVSELTARELPQQREQLAEARKYLHRAEDLILKVKTQMPGGLPEKLGGIKNDAAAAKEYLMDSQSMLGEIVNELESLTKQYTQ